MAGVHSIFTIWLQSGVGHIMMDEANFSELLGRFRTARSLYECHDGPYVALLFKNGLVYEQFYFLNVCVV
jgi:hypothetical protein